MNEEDFKKFTKSFRSISLTSEEKKTIKENILAEINSMETSRIARPSRLRIWDILMRERYVFAATAIFLMVGGTALAAEQSLPGDFLYPVKVELNEKVAGVLLVGTSREAEHQVNLIEKRFKEVQSLILKEKLSVEKVATVEKRLMSHTEKVKEYLKELEKEKNFEKIILLENKLESSFSENEKLFSKFSSEIENLSPLALKTKESLEEFTSIRLSHENLLKEQPEKDLAFITEESLKNASEALNDVEDEVLARIDYLKKSGGEIPENIKFIEEYLKVVREKISDGKAKLGSKLYSEAAALFGEAYRLVSEAKSLLDAETRLKVIIEPSTEILGRVKSIENEIDGDEIKKDLPLQGEVKGSSTTKDAEQGQSQDRKRDLINVGIGV